VDTPDHVPEREVTMDQVVAANMRHWRRAAGMTQDELGKAIGWSAANVSAVERSADDGRDRRRFDAQAIADIAAAVGVPLAALFMPPGDDDIAAAYVIRTAGGEWDMADLMERLVMPDSDEDLPVLSAYRERFREAARRYLAPEWADIVERWLSDAGREQDIADQASRLRDRRDEALRIAVDLGELADAFDRAAKR